MNVPQIPDADLCPYFPVTIRVVSDKFEGVKSVKRQQMVRIRFFSFLTAAYSATPSFWPGLIPQVYKVIWDEMQEDIHAVDEMVCKAPSEL